MKTIVSFSGGRTSAYMAKILKEKTENLLFVFANTGKERQETLDFIRLCELNWEIEVIWLEYDLTDNQSTFKIVSYETASRNGEPFEKMIRKYGLPNITRPHCSRELKEGTIRRYLRSIGLNKGSYKTALGIRVDEAHRINWAKAKNDFLFYPLATDFPTTKEFIRKWWSLNNFNLQLKDYEGNCDFCWKKSLRKLLTLAIENPKIIDWWADMETKYGDGEFTFFRGEKGAIDILDFAKNNKFEKAKDEFQLNQSTPLLFDYELDAGSNCSCGVF